MDKQLIELRENWRDAHIMLSSAKRTFDAAQVELANATAEEEQAWDALERARLEARGEERGRKG